MGTHFINGRPGLALLMRARLRVALIMVALLSADDVQAGGQERAGTAAAELLIPVGARDMAMSGATIATSAGLGALHWNPAGLARGDAKPQLLFSTMSYLAGIRVNYAAVSGHSTRLGTVAFSLKALDFGSIPITTSSQPDGTGATFSPTFLTTGLTWARPLSPRILLGGTLHYVSNRIERVSANAVSVNAGLQYSDLGDVAGLDLGVVIKHIGSRLRYDGSALLRPGSLDGLRRPTSVYKIEASSADLPSTFEIGLGYHYHPVPSGQAEFAIVFEHHNFAHDRWKLGGEYLYRDFFAARGGFDYADNGADSGADDGAANAHIYGTSFGFGLQLDLGGLEDLQLDYAYTTVEFFDPLSTFTFRVGF